MKHTSQTQLCLMNDITQCYQFRFPKFINRYSYKYFERNSIRFAFYFSKPLKYSAKTCRTGVFYKESVRIAS